MRLALIAGFLVVAAPALAADVVTVPGKGDSTRFEGQVEVAASADEVWKVMTAYESWPDVFSDVASAKIVGEDGGATKVKLKSRSTKSARTFRFEALPDERIVRFSVTDAQAVGVSAEWFVEQAADGSTRIAGSVVATPTKWWVPVKIVRDRGRARLEKDLADLQKRFGVPDPLRVSKAH